MPFAKSIKRWYYKLFLNVSGTSQISYNSKLGIFVSSDAKSNEKSKVTYCASPMILNRKWKREIASTSEKKHTD